MRLGQVVRCIHDQSKTRPTFESSSDERRAVCLQAISSNQLHCVSIVRRGGDTIARVVAITARAPGVKPTGGANHPHDANESRRACQVLR